MECHEKVHLLFNSDIMDSLTENIRKEGYWWMKFADDVVLCAWEKDELEIELEPSRRVNESVKSKRMRSRAHICLNRKNVQ